jgi:hypothetical protein
MRSYSGVDGVENGAEVFGCHLVIVFYESEQGKTEEDVGEDPEVVRNGLSLLSL